MFAFFVEACYNLDEYTEALDSDFYFLYNKAKGVKFR